MKRKIIMTEADLLAHSYGTKETPEVSIDFAAPVIMPPAPPPAPPEIAINLEPADVDAIAAALVDKYTKADLIEFAKDQGLDIEGNKAALAQRLAKAGFLLLT